MSKTKKSIAAALAVFALAAVPATSVALSDSSEGLHFASSCGGTGGGGCK